MSINSDYPVFAHDLDQRDFWPECRGLPWTEDVMGYGKVMLIMVLTFAMTIALLRQRRLSLAFW